MRPLPRALWVLLGLFGSLLLGTTSAHAVEYRLLVASIFDTTLMSFVSPPELVYGASGPGLERVEKELDTGQIGVGAMPAGRPLVSVSDDVAKAWGGVPVHGMLPARGDAGRWDEVRWQGNPGERSIWMVKGLANARPQSIRRVTLEGMGPIRQYQPYTYTGKERLAVLLMPQSLIMHYESRGNVWEKWVGNGLSLDGGIAAVVARSNNALSPDSVYLIVQQTAQPTTYRTVVSWSDREIDREGIDVPQIMNNGRH